MDEPFVVAVSYLGYIPLSRAKSHRCRHVVSLATEAMKKRMSQGMHKIFQLDRHIPFYRGFFLLLQLRLQLQDFLGMNEEVGSGNIFKQPTLLYDRHVPWVSYSSCSKYVRARSWLK